jgi:DtxR family transcriptional regulator, Mn-dependent transcriptional regulator
MTKNEEDYLKAIYKLLDKKRVKDKLGTNVLAEELGVTPASANNMIKKLSAKGLVHYEKYGHIELSEEGKQKSIILIRKHRLWETFLHQTLGFNWTEVHEIAEQLEHIQSDLLIQRLDAFLGYPTLDPHGDVIPDAFGNFSVLSHIKLSEAKTGHVYTIVSVKDNSTDLLNLLESKGLVLGIELMLRKKSEFDQSLDIEINGNVQSISVKVADNLMVEEAKS